MNSVVKEHPILGRCLFADNGCVEIGIPLEFGLRIGHFSLCGEKNVFFEQPRDMTDLTTPDGWRVRGGHRLWLAPESEKLYRPDNDPIHYEILDDGIKITQMEDPWLHIIKSMQIIFSDGVQVQVVHRVVNTGSQALRCSLWAISSLAPGGTEDISFALREGGFDPWHRVSMWDYTSLGDPRAEYRRDGIRLTHRPLEEKYKIGVGHPYGPVRYENNGVTFIKEFPVALDKDYPDGNVSFETFMCKHMLEMESLSHLMDIPAGGAGEYTEIWSLRR